MKRKIIGTITFTLIIVIVFIGGFITGGYFIINKIDKNHPKIAYSYRIYSDSVDEIRNINSDNLYISPEWILDRLTDEEINQLKNTKEKSKELIYFLSILQDNDHLFHFETPFYTWYYLSGRKGIVIIRNRRPVYGYITSLN